MTVTFSVESVSPTVAVLKGVLVWSSRLAIVCVPPIVSTG